MTVLASGATGTTGTEVIRRLRAAGATVRALTREADTARRFTGDGVEGVVADLARPESLERALEGIETVYVATNSSPQLPELEGNLARAAASAGVRLLVKLSVIGAAADAPITFARLHHASEEALRAAGVPYAFLRSNGFMQNTLAWAAQIPEGVIRGPAVDARWSIVDVRDIAAVAVAALLNPEAVRGRTYTLTGPEPSSPREQVAILALLDRPLAAEEVSIERAESAMRGAGWPAQAAAWMGELLRLYADGLAVEVSPDIELVTGRPARSYRQFAADQREAFLAAV